MTQEIVWCDFDEKGRISSVYRARQPHHFPPEGSEDTAEFRARFARIDNAEFRSYKNYDFASIAKEKFDALPKKERTRIIRSQFADELAVADHDLSDPTASNEAKAKAKALYEELNRRIGA